MISFEAWTKLAQKWLVCAPLRIHLEPINKELMLLVTIYCATGPKKELCSAKEEALRANGLPYELIKNIGVAPFSLAPPLFSFKVYSENQCFITLIKHC